MEKHSTQARSEAAGEVARLQVCGDLHPRTFWSRVTARPWWGPRQGPTVEEGGVGDQGRALAPVLLEL